jgi:hypothetical protein
VFLLLLTKNATEIKCMKITDLIIGLGVVVVLASRVYGDATVRLNNYDSLMPVYWQEVGKLAYGNDFYIQVLGTAVGGVPTPITPVGATTSIIKLKEPGYFDAGIGVILGVSDNQPATFAVRGWYGDPSYQRAAEAANAGQTYVWDQFAGSWDPNSGLAPSGPLLAMPWPLEIGFAIPEPTTLTLAVFGAVLVLGASRINKGR